MTYLIEWIGTGSGLNPVLGNTSFLLTRGNRKLLVDCGFSVPIELIKQKKLNDVTDVLITHLHADHIGGLEGFGFMNYFAYKKRNDSRPNLYLATNSLAQTLWDNSLSGGMKKSQEDNNESFDATLETYFKITIGKEIIIDGLPKIVLFPTPHVKNMENYGLNLENKIFYSGDSVALPQTNFEIIFQDCQFYETSSDVHISYDKLNRDLSSSVKAKTYLVHLGGGWDNKNPKSDGFAGFVKPGDTFSFR